MTIKKDLKSYIQDIDDAMEEIKKINKIDKKQIRAGILRCNEFTLKEITEFLVGNKRFINKNLRLIKVRMWNDGIDTLPYYDFVFMGDDLPIVTYGCSAQFLDIEKVDENSFKLVEEAK